MPEKVLIVDDDKAILELASRVLQDIDCHVISFNDPLTALEYLGQEEVAVLITDNKMPVMHGLELIEKANSISPETVKIIMSAYADLPMALCAINQCQVFKFITKPWEPTQLAGTVTDALRRYSTFQIIRRENEDVLRSLAQTIELKDPCTKGHCDRVATFAVQIAKHIGMPTDIQREIKYGSWLHDCGKIGVSEMVLNARRKLKPEEYEQVKKHPVWGADVAKKANLSSTVVNVVLSHHERYDGHGYPNGLAGDNIPLEARIVSVADIFDAISSDRPYRKSLPLEKSIALIESMKGKELDAEIVDIFTKNKIYKTKSVDSLRENETRSTKLIVDSHLPKKLILQGDFTIAGVNDQIPRLIQQLEENETSQSEKLPHALPYEIDLIGIEDLDASGCQLVAAVLHNLRHQGFKEFSFNLSDCNRDKIRLLGFSNEIPVED